MPRASTATGLAARNPENLELAAHGFAKAAQRDLVDLLGRIDRKVVEQCGAGPGACAGPCQHRQMKGSEIGQTDPVLVGLRQLLEIEHRQQPGEAIAAPGDHDNRTVLVRGSAKCGGSAFITTGESLRAAQGCRVESGRVAEGIEHGSCAAGAGGVVDCTRRRDQIDGWQRDIHPAFSPDNEAARDLCPVMIVPGSLDCFETQTFHGLQHDFPRVPGSRWGAFQ